MLLHRYVKNEKEVTPNKVSLEMKTYEKLKYYTREIIDKIITIIYLCWWFGVFSIPISLAILFSILWIIK